MQLSQEKIGKLLHILETIQSGEQASRHELKCEALENLLATEVPVPAESDMLNLQEWVYLYRFADPDASRTLRTLLSRPDTHLEAIIRIKGLSKTMARAVESRIESSAARIVYYAAIAYALVHHQCKITSLPYPMLVQSFAKASRKKWVAKDIAGLIKAALLTCSDKTRLG